MLAFQGRQSTLPKTNFRCDKSKPLALPVTCRRRRVTLSRKKSTHTCLFLYVANDKPDKTYSLYKTANNTRKTNYVSTRSARLAAQNQSHVARKKANYEPQSTHDIIRIFFFLLIDSKFRTHVHQPKYRIYWLYTGFSRILY